jgi:hypothetical protein
MPGEDVLVNEAVVVAERVLGQLRSVWGSRSVGNVFNTHEDIFGSSNKADSFEEVLC